MASGRNSEVLIFTPPACTAEQLEMTAQRHPGEKEGDCYGLCPTTFLTCCPRATWLEEYYNSQHQQNSKKKSFFAINVGCNKGYDAVNLLRMGSNNPDVNRQMWKDAVPPALQAAACNQDQESTMALVTDPSLSQGIETNALVYCIEPMPSTFEALLNASRINKWDEQLKVRQIAMNNEDPSTVLFPGPESENLVGVEDIGIKDSCSDTPDTCVSVESSRLDAMMTKEKLNKRLNILLIDVEGYDFDVILGANATLRNTEYIEFEYRMVGKVSSKR